jgi:4'-phosphopantetheinyl transferase
MNVVRIDIWTFRTAPQNSDCAPLLACLSADERRRAASYRHITDRIQFVTARAGLRNILWNYTAFAPAAHLFAITSSGKPQLRNSDSPVFFNLSHSDGLIAIAVSRDAEVGIDVEKRHDTAYQELEKTICSPFEEEWMASLPLEERCHAFYRLWTVKEAMTKAEGSGLSISLPKISVNLSVPSSIEILAYDNRILPWSIAEIPTPDGYAGAVATFGRSLQISHIEVPATAAGLPNFPDQSVLDNQVTPRPLIASTLTPRGCIAGSCAGTI